MTGYVIGPSGVLPTAVGGGYVGPGDIITATPLAFWSLRAYSAAKATAAVNCIDIVDIGSANSATLAVQANGDLNQTAIAAGTMAGSTLAAWITAFGTPFVHKIYDQVGIGNFDVTSNTTSGAPLILNLYGTRPGIQFSGSVRYLSTNTLTQNQPYSLTSVSKRTSGTSSNDGILGTASPYPLLIGYYSVANTLEQYGGVTSGLVSPVTEGVGHAVQWIFNGPSSFWVTNVDGVDITPSPAPGNTTSGNISASVIGLADRAGGAIAGGDIEEVGMWAGAIASGGANGYLALQANQKLYWGTP